MNKGFKEIVWEGGNHPSGLKIGKSIEPINRMGFNEWANELNVSSSYVDTTPIYVPAMEMIARYGVEDSKNSFKLF